MDSDQKQFPPEFTKTSHSDELRAESIRHWLIRNLFLETELESMSEEEMISEVNSIRMEIKSFSRRVSPTHFPLRAWTDAKCPPRHAERMKDCLMTAPKHWMSTAERLISHSKRGDGYMVALLGGRGVGKTQIAVTLIRWCCLVMNCRYVKASDLFREIRSTYSRESKLSERDVFELFTSYTLLVIDEVHQRGDTVAENNALTQIIDGRYDRKLDTVLIANQLPQEFAASMGPSVVSRIHETGDAILCDWPSFRHKGQWEESK